MTYEVHYLYCTTTLGDDFENETKILIIYSNCIAHMLCVSKSKLKGGGADGRVTVPVRQ
jgi:hypothetical protein